MIQVYTGNGKGKTTAALGLAIRAAGCGKKVYIGQFLKGQNYGELRALKKFRNIKAEQLGRACFVGKSPTDEDRKAAKEGFARVKKIISTNKYDLVILDEIIIAVKFGLIEIDELIALLKKSQPKTELVLTGRYAHPKMLEIADLVSEIKEVKHYFNKGLPARKGIEF